MKNKQFLTLGFSFLFMAMIALGIYYQKTFSTRHQKASAYGHIADYSDNEIGQAGYPDIAFGNSEVGVVVWHQKAGGDFNIYGQRVNKNGAKEGSIFQINQFVTNDQKFPKVSISSIGDFVVTWQSFGQDGNQSGIYAQRYKASGYKNGSEFKVNTYIAYNQITPDIAMKDDGSFVIAWVSERQDKSPKSIYAKMFNVEGTPMSKELKVNFNNKNVQTAPDVAINKNGQILIVWQSLHNGDWDIYGQILTQRKQTLLVKDLLIHPENRYEQIQPDVTVDRSDNFLVSWSHKEPSLSQSGFFKENIGIQKISSSGTKMGKPYSLHSSLGHQQFASIDSLNQWTSIVWQSFRKGEWQLNVQDLNSSGAPLNQLTILNANFELTVTASQRQKSDKELKFDYKEDQDKYNEILRNNRIDVLTENNLHPSLALDGSGNKNIAWEFYSESLEAKVILFKQINILSDPIILSLTANEVENSWMLSRVQMALEKMFWFIKGVTIQEGAPRKS